MKIKTIITGSTGMVGKGVLLECLDSPQVDKVLIINRHTVGIEHPKLREIIHSDLSDVTNLEKELAGFNTCFFCLGVSAAGLSEIEYSKITYELTLNFARTVLQVNPEINFCFVSGAGTDSSEKGKVMWARIKGKTENALFGMNFKSVYMFRPGLIQPKKGVKSRTRAYNIVYFILWPFFPLLKLSKNIMTDTVRVGKAMINVAILGCEKKILTNEDINHIASITK